MYDDKTIRRKLTSLLRWHIVAGIVCVVLADADGRSPAQAGINMLFTALVGSELCLLGLALAADVVSPPGAGRRLSYFALGFLWVWLLSVVPLVRTTGALPPAFLLLLPPAIGLAAGGVGFALRAWGARLVRVAGGADAPAEALRFSLRHLLAMTGAVGVVLAIGRAVRAAASIEPEDAIVILAVMSVLTVGVALATLWAALGTGRPLSGLAIACSLAALVGLLPAYCFNRSSPYAYVGLAAIALLLSIITAASLLVVRHCRYRLVRQPAGGRELAGAVRPS